MKILFNMFSIFYLWEHTLRVWYKNLWNWHVIDIWPFDLAPRSSVWPYDENVACILFCSSSPSIWYATWPCLKKIFFDPLGTLVPPSPIPGAWPRWQNKNPVWYVLYLSFVRTHTQFGIKIFEIDFVIEIKWYLIFWPLPRAPGGGAKKNWLRVPFMWVTHTPNLGWIRSNG